MRWRIIYCICPPSYLQHQYAARSGAGITASLAVIRSDEGDARREKLADSLRVFVPEYRICRLRLLIHQRHPAIDRR